jgi:hypothetical protein
MTTSFPEMTLDELTAILSLTIRKDDVNKVISFLAALSAFGGDCSLNVSFNSPSSSGKSYIPLEIAKLFPKEDVLDLGYCSPTAFFHDHGKWEKGVKELHVDLARKILIFMDQPGTQLLERLRPVLSHDKEEIRQKITDKQERAGMRTKTVILRGHPAVFFCSAGFQMDEQELTRFILLSAEIDSEKLIESVKLRAERDAIRSGFEAVTEANPKRIALKERIAAIRDLNVRTISVPNYKLVIDSFLNRGRKLKPRDQRDVGRVMSIIKSWALLNAFTRQRADGRVFATEADVYQGLLLWELIAACQELGISPYLWEVYRKVILPSYQSKNPGGPTLQGVSRREIAKAYFEHYGRPLPDWKLRQDFLPALEVAGLIVQEPDPNQKTRLLVHPTGHLTYPGTGT